MRRSLLALSLLGACHPRPTPPLAKPVPAPASYLPAAGIPGPSHVAFHLPRHGAAAPFADLPWPSELDRDRAGTLDFRGFPDANGFLIRAFVNEARRDVDGWSLAQTVYFRVEGDFQAPPRLLDPKPTSAVVLADVDPDSPTQGTIVPVETRTYERDGAFVQKGTIAVRPIPGFVLREHTLYAAIVRRDLGDPSGTKLGTTDDLEAIKWTEPRSDPDEEAARKIHRSAWETFDRLGIGREDVAGIALFRTQNATAVLAAAPKAIGSLDAKHAPRIVDAHWDETKRGARYDVVVGHYCAPNFQSNVDDAPFLRGGGAVEVDAAGVPRVADVPEGSKYRSAVCGPDLFARFVLAVPRGAKGEVPLLVTAHGTGGDATTFLGDRDFAGWSAAEGIAVVSTDQPLHGDARDPGRRPGAGVPVALPLGAFDVPLSGVQPGALFYNPLNPAAARGNLRQATLDAVALARLFGGLDLAKLPLDHAPDAHLRASPVFAAGHSQGSQSIAILGAVDPVIATVILSGCGGDLRYGVLGNREFAPIRELLVPLLGLQPGELDVFHPVLALVQLDADADDPESYAARYATKGTSVLHFEGLGDGYVPEPSPEALAAALRATPLTPLLHPFPAAHLLDLRAQPAVRGNAGNGAATLAFVQLAPSHGENGHFVIYEEPEGRDLFRRFLATALASPPPAAGPLTSSAPPSRTAP